MKYGKRLIRDSSRSDGDGKVGGIKRRPGKESVKEYKKRIS